MRSRCNQFSLLRQLETSVKKRRIIMLLAVKPKAFLSRNDKERLTLQSTWLKIVISHLWVHVFISSELNGEVYEEGFSWPRELIDCRGGSYFSQCRATGQWSLSSVETMQTTLEHTFGTSRWPNCLFVNLIKSLKQWMVSLNFAGGWICLWWQWWIFRGAVWGGQRCAVQGGVDHEGRGDLHTKAS